jgi:hypothetical protein
VKPALGSCERRAIFVAADGIARDIQFFFFPVGKCREIKGSISGDEGGPVGFRGCLFALLHGGQGWKNSSEIPRK